MARSLREDGPGAWHHVMNRGARRAPTFDSDRTCSDFLGWLQETSEDFDIEIHAYALMTNHYHLLVRSVRGNLSRAMRHLGAGFTQELNRRRGWDGPLFRGRFRNQVLRSEDHVVAVAAYIHLNPIRAGIVRRLDQHCWTSHRAYLGLDPAPAWLHRDVLLDHVGGEEAFGELVYDLRRGRGRWPEELDLERGWFTGGEEPRRPWAFRTRRRLEKKVKSHPARPTDVLKRVARVTGIGVHQLSSGAAGRTGNPARRFAAWALNRDTELTHREVGALLGMSSQQVAVTLRRLRKQPGQRVGAWIEAWGPP